MGRRGLIGTLLGGVAILLLAGGWSVVFASQGIVGDCSNCHTMHNSEQGKPVAKVGASGTISADPIPNLLKYDCIACHAMPGADQPVMDLNGSSVPQVGWGNDSDDLTTNLAGGNFNYITKYGDRSGHNVVDIVAEDGENQFPPGHRHATAAIGEGGFDVSKFTCAGSMGCHGYRGQVLNSSTVNCDEFGYNQAYYPDLVACTAAELAVSGQTQYNYRTGLSALSGYDGPGSTTTLKRGAHHENFDGLKNQGLDPNFYDNPLAKSYRFIRGLRGYGNEVDRWQNKSATSHNEYAAGYDHTPVGAANKSVDFGSATCNKCHVGGSVNATDSRLTTPSSTISGFCVTCHGRFHSSGVTNGSSGAFLRHPSDYVIPDRGEYSAYTTYNVSAPVGRPGSFFVAGMTASEAVTPGTDLVMCLSCHVAHASPYEYMLRFDYTKMRAGDAAAADQNTGCLGCHTSKGILPENR